MTRVRNKDAERKGVVRYYEYENLKQLVESGKCHYGDIAIPLKSVKHYSNHIIEELDRNEIPYIVGGDAGLFKGHEISVLRYFFAMLR